MKKTCQSIKSALARSHLSCGRFSFILRPHTLGVPYYFEQCKGIVSRSPKKVCQVSWFHLRFAAFEIGVCPVVIVLPGSLGYKKRPRQSGAFFIQSEAGASRRLSTCRPCRPCHPCRQAWQERPSWGRAFRRWRIRWSAAGRPRKRRSAGRYGSPSWGR